MLLAEGGEEFEDYGGVMWTGVWKSENREVLFFLMRHVFTGGDEYAKIKIHSL